MLEPAAGVGHMVRELRRGHGLEVIANDLHAYEDPLVPDIGIADIRAIDSLKGFKWALRTFPMTNKPNSARISSTRRPRRLQRRPAHAQ